MCSGALTVPLDSRLCQDGFHARVVMLFSICKAALIHWFLASVVVSCCESNKSPLIAIVAADESAGRGTGALKSLKQLLIYVWMIRKGIDTSDQGTVSLARRLLRKYVASLRAVTRYLTLPVRLNTILIKWFQSQKRNKRIHVRTIRETIYTPCLAACPSTAVRITLSRPLFDDETGGCVIFNNMPCGPWLKLDRYKEREVRRSHVPSDRIWFLMVVLAWEVAMSLNVLFPVRSADWKRTSRFIMLSIITFHIQSNDLWFSSVEENRNSSPPRSLLGLVCPSSGYIQRSY